jgi:hypothetical protein
MWGQRPQLSGERSSRGFLYSFPTLKRKIEFIQGKDPFHPQFS